MAHPPLFDAVLFDLDGTLVATDRFWIQAAKAGARRAFEELGLERALPTRDEWMSLVGHPLSEGFARLFADLPEGSRRLLLARCEEEEERLIAGGAAAWMPGARTVVETLHAGDVRLGIASNCSNGYLQQMGDELRLKEQMDAALCLDSPGISNKADMISWLLEHFDTRSAIFVGDRAGDRNAAWANGIPHVHCSFGFAGAGEEVEAEATIGDMGELPSVLERRTRWIEGVLRGMGVGLGDRGPMVLGVTGDLAAGKTLFARDAARILRAHGQEAVAISLAAWEDPKSRAAGSAEVGGPELLFDLDRLERDLFDPLGAGSDLPLAAFPEGALVEVRDQELGAGGPTSRAVVLLEGPFLLDPRLQRYLDRVVYLEVSEEVLWRRVAGREGRAEGVSGLERIRSERLPGLLAHRERYRPTALADRVIDASNPLGPGAAGT